MKFKNIITLLILATSLIGHGIASDSDSDRGGGGGGGGGGRSSSSSEEARPAKKPTSSYNYSHHSSYSAPVPSISFTPPPSPVEHYSSQPSSHRDTTDITRTMLTAVVVDSVVGDDDNIEDERRKEQPNRTGRQSRSSRTSYQTESSYTPSNSPTYRTFPDSSFHIKTLGYPIVKKPSAWDCDYQCPSEDQCIKRTIVLGAATGAVVVVCLWVYYSIIYATWL